MAKVDHLFIEIQNGNIEAVKAFLKESHIDLPDNYGRTVLLNAALYGKLELVKWVVENGAYINHTDKNGYTALHFSAQEAHTDVVKFLLKNEANPNIQDKNGNTPSWVTIMYWAGGKNYDTLQAFVNANADLTLKNKAGRAAIDLIPEKIKEQLGIS